MAVAIARMALPLVRRELSRGMDKVRKRVARLEAAGLSNTATMEFRFLESAIKAGSVDPKQALRDFRKIETKAGTTARGAERQLARDTARWERDHVAASTRTLPDEGTVDRVLRREKQRAERNIKNIKEKVGQTPGTTFTQDTLDELKERMAEGPMTKKTKAAYARKLIKQNEYQGMSIKGARAQQQRGIDAFGPDYAKWTPEEQASAWRGFREYAERLNDTMSSDAVLAEVKGATSRGELAVAFRRDDPTPAELQRDPNAQGRLVAHVAVNSDEAERAADLAGHNAKLLEKAQALAKRKVTKVF